MINAHSPREGELYFSPPALGNQFAIRQTEGRIDERTIGYS